jgi:protein-S-isoprenylcysteine O-methyltransferase Ste14
MNTFFTGLKALFYGALFFALWIWVISGVGLLDDVLPIRLLEGTRIYGVVAICLGGIIALYCLGVFVIRGKGTPAVFEPPREFVATGPYRHVRNPMYIGGWLMILGLGLLRHSLSIAVFSFICLLLTHLFVVLYEEPGLEKRFGESYLRYKKSVNRWIPHW